ncbi:hypothetical protein Tco_0794572 [Tanacetum coccineum]
MSVACGGLPDTIHGSVMATKPKTMQDAIEFATELMDKKINTWAERQADNKRKSDDTARNNQNQQQNKRQNTGRAYAAGNDDKRPYGGPRLLCAKCNYHHDGPCAPKCHKCHRFGHLGRIAQNERTTTTGVIRLDMPRLRQSSRIVITPTALDHDYNVKLADGRIVGLNTILRGCTLKLLNHPFNIDLMPVELVFPEGLAGVTTHSTSGVLNRFGTRNLRTRLHKTKFLTGVLVLFVKKKVGSFRLVHRLQGIEQTDVEEQLPTPGLRKKLLRQVLQGVILDFQCTVLVRDCLSVGDKQEAAFQLLKQKLVVYAQIWPLLEGKQRFHRICEASKRVWLRWVDAKRKGDFYDHAVKKFMKKKLYDS